MLLQVSHRVSEIPVKALISLSCLVAYPRHYSPFEDRLAIHRMVQRVFDGSAEGEYILCTLLDAIFIAISEELEPYQHDAYTIANRVLLAASKSMSVGYRTCVKDVQLGEGKCDFFFVFYAGQQNWAWPGLYVNSKTWDALILGKYVDDNPLSMY